MPNARNIEQITANAQLEFAPGMVIVDPLKPDTNCDLCQARKICDQVMQEESETILPESRLCATTQGIRS